LDENRLHFTGDAAMTNPSGAYLPADRRLALVQGAVVAEHAEGAVLFADISGFTPLTEALATALGRSRGAELLTLTLNRVYQALIDEIDRYGGSVIGFAGDAITCWFAAAPFRAGAAPAELPDAGALTAAVGCAITCAGEIHRAMARFAAAEVAPGVTAAMSVKVAIAAGWVHRFLVGDPDVQCIDVLAGAPLEAMAAAEQQGRPARLCSIRLPPLWPSPALCRWSVAAGMAGLTQAAASVARLGCRRFCGPRRRRRLPLWDPSRSTPAIRRCAAG
jgi:class 3 adenylate cyclase